MATGKCRICLERPIANKKRGLCGACYQRERRVRLGGGDDIAALSACSYRIQLLQQEIALELLRQNHILERLEQAKARRSDNDRVQLARNQRHETLLSMRAEGKTLRAIADVMGVTRQRVQQIIKAKEGNR